MYKIIRIKDKVRVPAELMKLPTKEAIKEVIIREYERKYVKNVGLLLAFVKVLKVGEGEILPEDPAVYYDAEFEMLVYEPQINEIVEGEVKNIMEFGAFVEIGPLDGMIHVSQITDDVMTFSKSKILQGKNTKKTLKIGDIVRARIIAVSFREGEPRIGLVSRQPGLGKLEWIEEERKKERGGK